MAYYKVRIEVWCDWNPAESDLEDIAQSMGVAGIASEWPTTGTGRRIPCAPMNGELRFATCCITIEIHWCRAARIWLSSLIVSPLLTKSFSVEWAYFPRG